MGAFVLRTLAGFCGLLTLTSCATRDLVCLDACTRDHDRCVLAAPSSAAAEACDAEQKRCLAGCS